MFLVRVCLCVRVSFCLFARCLLSFFSSFEFPGARRPFLFALSLCWVIFSRLCVCYLTFIRFFYYLFANWFCVCLVSLVLSLVRTMFCGCVDLALTFIWFGGREAEYDVVPVRELMMITPSPVVSSWVWFVRAACVWVLWLILVNHLCCVLLKLLCLLVSVLFYVFIL